jgi:hypothetical protein
MEEKREMLQANQAFEWEVKNVKAGVDREGNRIVDLHFRTNDLSVLLLASKIGTETIKLELKG